MVRRYLRSLRPRSWVPAWRWRTHHVVGAGFLASALGFYPAAAMTGLVPSVSTAYNWLTNNAPAIESEVESAAKDPTEYSKSLPGKIVSAVETLGAQAAAANGISLNPQAAAGNTQPAAGNVQPTTGGNSTATTFNSQSRPAATSGIFNKPAQVTNAPPAYPVNSYAPPAAYPNYPAAGYPQSAYPQSGYPPNYPYGYSAGYMNPAYGTGDIACYFSPAGGCTEAVVNEIRQAQQQILVQAYSFTSAPIANALVEAHNRGVGVYVVLDKSQKSEQYSSADFVAHAGIATLIDSAHAIAHNKVMLIDRQTIITGSFNFTASAEKSNAENLLVIRNRPDLYQAYENNFRHHYEHSQPYQGRGASHPGASQSNHSHIPASNTGPVNYYQAGNYPAQNQHQSNQYQQNQYQAGPYQTNQYQQSQYQGNQYQPSPYQSNPYQYGSGGYPQTASPSYPSSGYRY